MYESIVNDLRERSKKNSLSLANRLLMGRAADAIEELSKKANGEWIEEEGGWDDIYYTCSVCGDAVCTIDGTTVEDNGWNYCPTCGAKMIGIKRLPEPPDHIREATKMVEPPKEER